MCGCSRGSLLKCTATFPPPKCTGTFWAVLKCTGTFWAVSMGLWLTHVGLWLCCLTFECSPTSSTPLRRWFDGGGAKRGWFAGGGVLQDGSFTPGEGGGEVNSSNQEKFWRIMSSCQLFALFAHSSSAGAKLKKELLRQYLYLGLPGVLTKQLSAGASIAWGRMCKGDDLDEVLMPKLS
jgi:hypothetical protein